MADFERLIRGALDNQDASSAEVRKVVYQSSRNALQKIIDNNRSLTVEAVIEQKRQLEVSIDYIEAEYTAPKPDPVVAPVAETIAPVPAGVTPSQPVQPVAQVESVILAEAPTPQPAPVDIPIGAEPEQSSTPPPVGELPKVDPSDPLYEIQQILESTTPSAVTPSAAQPVVHSQTVAPNTTAAPNIEPSFEQEVAPQVDATLNDPAINVGNEYYEGIGSDNIPLGFQRRRKTQKRFLWTIIVLLILGLLGWIGYIAYMGAVDGSLLGQKDSDGPKLNPNSVSRQADSENYITVIDSTDLSSLVMAGRGKAEIVNQLNSNMIRINSERDALNRAEPAQPILIKLKPGVLEQISGKEVTIEVFAKSGGGDTAHFAIGCEFGNLTECGRKRFLAGSQPNASVFAFQMDKISDSNQDMFLTLSTDTTSQASVTGKGDILDIVYIRLSVNN